MIDLRLGNCLDVLPTLPDASVDAVICDPPYPEISRPYGRMTEAEWHAMMRVVVTECRRVLKPSGSAVFVLQPNYNTPGSMRLWLWDFVVWAGREWNLVQDAYWWNLTALPTQGCQRSIGLMRSSVKFCVWLGAVDCYRDQESVLWSESETNRTKRAAGRMVNATVPRSSGKSDNPYRCRNACVERGGTTPFNLLPIPGGGQANSEQGHSAPTSLEICDWWTRYISPHDGVTLDPFMGSGTTGLAALARGREFVGIERDANYFAIAEKRLNSALNATPLFLDRPMKITGKGQPVD